MVFNLYRTKNNQMNKAKNFFVRSKSVDKGSKGFMTYIEYLGDENHPNHQNKSKIINLRGDRDTFINNVTLDTMNRERAVIRANKGGRPISSYAQSFVISLPGDFVKPTIDQWKKIASDMVKTISAKIGISPKKVLQNSFINIHEQNNPHLNIVTGKIFDGKSYNKELTRPSTSNALKREIKRSVLVHTGKNLDDYVTVLPSGTTKGKRWDELRKKEEFLNSEYQRYLERLVQLSKLFHQYMDETDEKLRLEKEQNIKKEITSINKGQKIKRFIDDSDAIKDAEKELQSKEMEKIVDILNDKISKANKNKKGRNFRDIKKK